jgi:hypothetical protein
MLPQRDIRLRGEGIAPALERIVRRLVPFGIDFTDHREGVLIEPQPHMQAVFFDPLTIGSVAAARPLAAQPPALLIDGDGIFGAKLCRCAQLCRSCHRTDPAAQHRHPDPPRVFLHCFPQTSHAPGSKLAPRAVESESAFALAPRGVGICTGGCCQRDRHFHFL